MICEGLNKKLNKSLKKNELAFLFCFLVISALFVVNVNPNQLDNYSGDFRFHFYKSLGCVGEQIDMYAPLTSWIGGFFSFNTQFFYVFWLMFFFLVFPLALVYFSNWKAAVYWFAFFTPYYYLWGILAQGLVGFFLILFSRASPVQRLVLLGLAFLTHSLGLFLLLSYWAVEIIWDKKGFLAACVFVPTKSGASVEAAKARTGTNLLGGKGISGVNYLDFFRWFFINPLFFFGFFRLRGVEKLFSVLLFVGSLVLLIPRVLDFIVPFVCIRLAEEDHKLLFVLALVLIPFQVLNFASHFGLLTFSLTNGLFFWKELLVFCLGLIF